MSKHNCIEKERKAIMAADSNIEYIRFDLHNIRNISLPPTKSENKTGQRVWVRYKNKQREEKTFLTHRYCPFCGKKYKG